MMDEGIERLRLHRRRRLTRTIREVLLQSLWVLAAVLLALFLAGLILAPS
jgi:hypothetical protein